ncbi:MAG: hypothetical protein U0931_24135 [Vulcanimicrobiota bacterium]
MIDKLMHKLAKPPAPETRCVRLSEVRDVPEVPGLQVSGKNLVDGLAADQVVHSPTGEAFLPASLFGAQARKNPSVFFGVERVYGLDEAQQLRDRKPALKVRPYNLGEVAHSRYLHKSLQMGPEGTGFLVRDDLPRCFSRGQTYTYLADQPRQGLGDEDLRSFGQLTGLQQSLLGGQEYGQKRWSSEFSPRQMKAFLVLTELWEHPERIDRYSQSKGQKPLAPEVLEKLKVTPADFEGVTLGTIHSDRKHFEVTFCGSPQSMQRLARIFGQADHDAKGAQTERGYLADRPYKPFHPDTQMGGGRSPNSHYSLQFMLGEDGGAGDVDMFQPLHLPGETSPAELRSAFVRHWAKHWGEIILGKNLLPDYMKPDKLAEQLQIPLYQ